MGNATKRIPVSEDTWKELGKEKEPGQTWDELLRELKRQADRARLADDIRAVKDGDAELEALDDV